MGGCVHGSLGWFWTDQVKQKFIEAVAQSRKGLTIKRKRIVVQLLLAGKTILSEQAETVADENIAMPEHRKCGILQ